MYDGRNPGFLCARPETSRREERNRIDGRASGHRKRASPAIAVKKEGNPKRNAKHLIKWPYEPGGRSASSLASKDFEQRMDYRHKDVLRPRPIISIPGSRTSIGAELPKRESMSGFRRPSLMQAPVLVLNATFEPINVTAVRRALVLMLKGVAQAEETQAGEVHSTTKSVSVPSVIRLLTYRHIPQQSRALSRKNILLRDRNTCQFCGHIFSASDLTLDHVVPRSRGGRSSWENLVACCYECNNRKGDRTPEEAGLKLARRPRPFTLHTSRQLMRLIGHKDEKWRKYLFY